jgi:hypothetical protein
MPGNLGIHKAQISFVHERGRLQRVPGCFVGHGARRHGVQFVINERHESVEGAGISAAPIEQKLGNRCRRCHGLLRRLDTDSNRSQL